MIIKPATILNVSEFCKRTWPKYDAAAPKIIKTKEKPKENNIRGVRFIFFLSSNSFKDAPETKEIYPIMCPFCGHQFEDEEITEYGEEDEDDWD